MQVGVSFPRDGLRNDRIAARDFGQAAEALGFKYIAHGDHVVGRPGLEETGRPTLDPLVLLGYLAACTEEIGLVAGAGVVVLPQRQTVLFAKQAASIDVLSGGRLSLHLSVGWNDLEYQALNEDFANRGRRMDEQIELLRMLWTQERIEFKGAFHEVDSLGINPLPVQRPIPIWLAGYADAALRRAANVADGYIPQHPPGAARVGPSGVKKTLDRVREYVVAAGRSVDDFGVVGNMSAARGTPEDWMAVVEEWRDMRVSHLTVGTGGAEGPSSPADHLASLRRFKDTLGVDL